MNVSRRWFIGGAVSFGALGGSRIFASDGFRSGCPNLTLGVLSDIHVKCRARPGEKISHLQNELTFIHALEWFRDQGVDGVVLPGDMSDNGSVELLTVVADAWFRVFPNGRAPDGRPVEQLFVYGNHDMLRAKHLRGMYKGLTDEQLKPYAISTNPKTAWEKAFREPFSPIWTKVVKGYRFVGAQWQPFGARGANELVNAGVADWYAAHAKEIDPSLPFFHIQHAHPKDTCYGPWAWGRDNGMTTRALSAFPNAIAVSGHSHYSLTDERSVWQGAFTSIGAGSLRCTGLTYNEFPGVGFENGSTPGRTKDESNAMKFSAPYANQDGRQGMLWRIYDDRIVLQRRDFLSDSDLGEDWVLPLPAAESKPFAFAERAKKIGAPIFPEGAQLAVSRVKAKNRGAKGNEKRPAIPSEEQPCLKVVIPAAVAKDGARAYRFDVEAKAGGKTVLKHLAAEGFDHGVAHPRAKGTTECLFALKDLPQGDVTVTVTPFNCFGRPGTPLSARTVCRG